MNKPTQRRQQKRHRLMLDFEDAESMATFVAELRRLGAITDDAHAYPAIALDFNSRDGVGRAQTYLIRCDSAELNELRGQPFTIQRQTIA